MSALALDKLSVMIVDDNQFMCNLVSSIMHVMGFRNLQILHEAKKAYASLDQNVPDFIIADLEMNPLDGVGFTKLIRRPNRSPAPFVPIIMMTAHSSKTNLFAARDAGISEFVVKPVAPENLYARIIQVIAHPRPFVQCDSYFGPERRRKENPNYKGPFRRSTDPGQSSSNEEDDDVFEI